MNTIHGSDVSLPSEQRLVRRVREALERGDFDGAERLCLDLLLRAPAHPDALGYVVQRALAAGRSEQALAASERALAAAPDAAPAYFHRGCAELALRLHAEACASFERALALDPTFALALFWRGAAEEALGRHDAALTTYFAALTAAQQTGVFEAAAQLSAEARARIEHGYDVVQGARAAVFDRALQPLRDAHGAAALARIQRGLDMYLGRIPREWPHPLQRPTFLLIPGLEPKPWFERERFPFLDTIEAETDAIRAEMLAVLTEASELRPYVDMRADAPAARIWSDLINSPRWSAYHLYRHGQRLEAHAQRCPRTIAALEAMPIMRIPDHSPEAMYSVLRPHTHIPPHTGVINGRLIVHLPLVVPPDCGMLRAGGEARPWVEGRCMVFDDSMAHEAWNDTDQTRVVLIFDIWNPLLSAVEQQAMAAAIDAIGQFHRRYGARDESHE
jgi:aspartate beta-hydroxylase